VDLKTDITLKRGARLELLLDIPSRLLGFVAPFFPAAPEQVIDISLGASLGLAHDEPLGTSSAGARMASLNAVSKLSSLLYRTTGREVL
jgi:hypothetical protein